jgi:hypothetical protein
MECSFREKYPLNTVSLKIIDAPSNLSQPWKRPFKVELCRLVVKIFQILVDFLKEQQIKKYFYE